MDYELYELYETDGDGLWQFVRAEVTDPVLRQTLEETMLMVQFGSYWRQVVEIRGLPETKLVDGFV